MRYAWDRTAPLTHSLCSLVEQHGPLNVKGIRHHLMARQLFKTSLQVRVAARSLRVQGLIAMDADRRWCLTGASPDT